MLINTLGDMSLNRLQLSNSVVFDLQRRVVARVRRRQSTSLFHLSDTVPSVIYSVYPSIFSDIAKLVETIYIDSISLYGVRCGADNESQFLIACCCTYLS